MSLKAVAQKKHSPALADTNGIVIDKIVLNCTIVSSMGFPRCF